MAKGLYKDWITEEGLKKISNWVLKGLTNEQIAHNIGINDGTLYEWCKKYKELGDTLKRCKEVADEQVENAMYNKAIGYTVTLHKQKVTQKGDVVNYTEEAHFPGDTTAQIFWLKNRQPEKWRDKVEQSVEFKDQRNLTIEFLEAVKDGKLTKK